jgi:hypothetical protein
MSVVRQATRGNFAVPAITAPLHTPERAFNAAKCLSTLKQTAHGCPRTIIYQTCLAAPTPSNNTRKPRPRSTSAFRRHPTFHIRARPLGRGLSPPHQHHLRRPHAERALLPSRSTSYAPLGHAPHLRRVPPRAPTAVRRVEHHPWLAPCRDAGGGPRRGPE